MGVLKDPQAYYWKLDSSYSTGENAGAVMDSLCQIMGQNTIQNGDSVVFVPGSGGAKGHFELGEGGSEVPPITSSLNQIIVGDGNNWAKGNNLGYMVTPTKAYDSEAGMPDEGTIGVYNPSFPLAFGELGAPSGSSGTTDYPYLKNGYVSRDNAVQKIQGKSKIVIGEENVDYSSQASSVYSFWSGTKNFSPSVVMSGTAQFQMLGGTTAYAKPVLSMLGNSVIEMNAYDWGSTYQGGYTRNQGYSSSDGYRLSEIAWRVYQETDSPFGSRLKDSAPFPYLRMNNSSTILMEGASLIKMADGAGVEIAGNAEISIRGGGGSTRYDGIFKTGIDIEPGSKIRMARDSNPMGGNFGPFFSMESGDGSELGSGKIVLTCAHNLNDNATVFDYPSNGFDSNQIYTNDIIDFGHRSYQYGTRLCSSIVGNNLGGFISGMESGIFQPTLKIEGRTHISIGDGGCFSAKIGPGSVYDSTARKYIGGYTQFDWTDEGNSYTQIKFGTGERGYARYQIGTYGSSTKSTIANYKICPEAGSETSFNFTPHGTTSLNISPEGLCCVAFMPHVNTDITIQTDTMYVDIEGGNTFIQKTGNFHEENHAGTSILRPTTQRMSYMNYTNGHKGLDWTAPVKNYEADAPVSQLYDGSNFCMIGDDSDKRYGSLTYETETQQTQADFEASQEYADLLDQLEEDGYTFVAITNFNSRLPSGSTTYSNTVRYSYKFYIPAAHLGPVLEMRNNSELRLRDGASIRGTTVNNEIQFQFDDGTTSVNFTVAELTALKTLLTQIPIQVVQSAAEATEPGIMYFVDGGGN